MKYSIRIYASVRYFITHPHRPNGYATLIICPADSHEPTYQETFSNIEDNIIVKNR